MEILLHSHQGRYSPAHRSAASSAPLYAILEMPPGKSAEMPPPGGVS